MNGLPLAGRRILVTRTQEGGAKLSKKLRELGAEAIEIPLIRIVPPASYDALDRALVYLGEYDLLLVTSANTARVLAERKPAPWASQPFTRCDRTSYSKRDARSRPARRSATEAVHRGVAGAGACPHSERAAHAAPTRRDCAGASPRRITRRRGDGRCRCGLPNRTRRVFTSTPA